MISKVAKSKKTQEEPTNDTEETEKVPNEVLVIAQEVKIINALASNDLSQRTKQLKKLRRWLTLRASSSFPFTEEDFLRIWKGLYYTMWMSDKPLVQEELAEELGKLINCFSDIKTGVQFFGAFLKTMCREWFGVDQWRMDKFLMLIRRMMRYMFGALKKDNWTASSIKEFNTHVFDTVLAQSTSGGITMHFMDVFFEELAKVSDGELTAKTVGQFAKPFVRFMAQQNDFKILGHCRNRIFHHLLYQSELGREYTEKYNAWKEMGFPTESINDLEKVNTAPETDDDEDESEAKTPQSKILDPRAGNVDVFIPLLPLDGKYIIKEIESIIYKEETAMRSRKLLKDILEKYQTYQSGFFPLGVQTMPKPNLKSDKPLISSKVEALENLENEIYSTTRKLKQLNKRKRRKLLSTLNFSEADEDTFEKLIEHSLPTNTSATDSHNGPKSKKRKSLAPMSWVEEEIDVTLKKLKKIQQVPGCVKKGAAQQQQSQELQQQQKSKKNDKAGKSNNNKDGSVNKRPSNDVVLQSGVSEWDKPLEDGELEYYVPSKKQQLKDANAQMGDLVPNPFAKFKTQTQVNQQEPEWQQQQKTQHPNSPKTPVKGQLLGKKMKKVSQSLSRVTSSSSSTSSKPIEKRVKIVLTRNTIQKPSEYIKQIKSSPNVPYDSERRPSKGLLKPNAMPSPINPFYKKKIGLKLLNDTL